MIKEIYKILVVEDDKMMQEVLVTRLSKEPIFKVYIANNGKEGLVSVLANNPDLILLDVIMPVMDGIQMFKELRKSFWSKNIPVIFLTSYDTSEEVLQSISEEKPAYYLLKSTMNLNDIVEKIKVTLGIK